MRNTAKLIRSKFKTITQKTLPTQQRTSLGGKWKTLDHPSQSQDLDPIDLAATSTAVKKSQEPNSYQPLQRGNCVMLKKIRTHL